MDVNVLPSINKMFLFYLYFNLNSNFQSENAALIIVWKGFQ